MRVDYSVTEAFVSWLLSLGYDAHTRVPDHIPDELVTIERTGGYVADLVDHPEMAIQCWSTSDERAAALADGVRNALLLEARPRGVSAVAIESGPYQFYDETTRCPRYQLVVEATCQLTD